MGGSIVTHRPAPLPIRWWLRATGFGAITMPWRIAYYATWPPDHELVAHEEIHLERYGPWGFTARYLWLLIRHGYEAHPMEIEAREISGHR
jgi:hypothetical protein